MPNAMIFLVKVKCMNVLVQDVDPVESVLFVVPKSTFSVMKRYIRVGVVLNRMLCESALEDIRWAFCELEMKSYVDIIIILIVKVNLL